MAARLRPDGRTGTNRQDDYVRALAFNLVPGAQQKRVVERLVTLIEQADDHLGAGFLSTPMILPVLALHRRADVAYRLLLQTSSPSWLADINTSTAIRENWDEFTKGDRRGSSNHYAFGSVANWMIAGIVGITPAAPGYQRVLFHPYIGGGLTHATATVPTPSAPAGESPTRP
jgi:alpha-L-rhamnosidase